MMKTIWSVMAASLLLPLGLAINAQGQEVTAKPMSKPGTVIEAEALLSRAKASAGGLAAQNMQGFGSQWSRGSQLFWRAPAPVDQPIRNWPSLTLPLDVAADGRYVVTVYFTAAPDYGNVRVFLRGQAAGDFAGYSAGVRLQALGLGERQLKAGSNQLVLTVFGKSAASANFFVGVDRIEVRPVAERPPPQRSATTAGRSRNARAGSSSPRDSMGPAAPQAVMTAAAHPAPLLLPAAQKAKLLSSAAGASLQPGQSLTLSARSTYLSLGGPDGADFAELVLNNCPLLLPDLPIAMCNAGSGYTSGSAGIYLPLQAAGQLVLVEFSLYDVKPAARYRISWQAADSEDNGSVVYAASSAGDVIYAVFKPAAAGYFRIWLESLDTDSFQLSQVQVTPASPG